MKVKKYIKQSYRYMLLLAMLTITTNLYAQFVDATRAMEWKLYGDAVSKKMAEQEALQLTISGNHIYMHAQNGKIVDIQDEMNRYLSKFHDKLKLAAMCYSLYYECKTVVENVQSINKSISENVCEKSLAYVSPRWSTTAAQMIPSGFSLMDLLIDCTFSTTVLHS